MRNLAIDLATEAITHPSALNQAETVLAIGVPVGAIVLGGVALLARWLVYRHAEQYRRDVMKLPAARTPRSQPAWIRPREPKTEYPTLTTELVDAARDVVGDAVRAGLRVIDREKAGVR